MSARPWSRSVAARSLSLLLLALGPGCRCGDAVDPVRAGFRPEQTELDFGRVLEGTQVTRQVELVSTGRGEVVVSVELPPPFSAPPEVTVPGATTTVLTVTFTAPDGSAEGTLRLSARGESFELPLSGRGVRPLACVPSGPCRLARFSLEQEACEESVAPDRSSCTPQSACLENGLCEAGACVGTARRCDDGNACTADACAEGTGCVNVDITRSCPRSSNPCEVPTCDPVQGCGFGPASDSTVCGQVDCVTANLCISGQCRQLPTPEGFLCAPSTPCQGEGRCAKGECARPDAGALVPSFSLPLPGVPDPVLSPQERLLGHAGNLYFGLCEGDGGVDCSLESYTGNGFLRFRVVDGGASPRAVSPSGVVVARHRSFGAFATANGAPIWSVPYRELSTTGAEPARPSPGAIAIGEGGEVYGSIVGAIGPDGGQLGAGGDGGLQDGGGSGPAPVDVVRFVLVPDGGLLARAQAAALGPERVLLTAAGAFCAFDRARLECAEADVDGGFGFAPLAEVGGLAAFSSGLSGTRLLVGARALLGSDGGFIAPLGDALPDGGEVAPLAIDAPTAAGLGFVLLEACAPPFPAQCLPEDRAPTVRGVDLTDGGVRWQVVLSPPGSTVVQHAAVEGPVMEGLLALTAFAADGGASAEVQLLSAGRRLFACPLPGSPQVAGAVFENGAAYVLTERAGLWHLEGYPLSPLTVFPDAWPRPGGVGGTRRER